MRCAKLLSYLMIEYEAPVIVRQAIRCARIFFFNLVDFEKLQFYQKHQVREMFNQLQIDAEPPNQIGLKKCDQNHEGDLYNCVSNKFILKILKKIGHRISNP